MAYDVKYVLFADGTGFRAHCDGRAVGEITFVRTGGDKLIIDHTEVSEQYRGASVGLGLVAAVVDLARRQKKKVIALCPFASAMFLQHPEFADVRLMNAR
ncbi:N-acetyltransferase [bacterium]|nr:N-acetyltransferase [bacterium]